MHHVIIGGSVPGISAAEAIQQYDASAETIMLSSERVRPYSRPMIASIIGKDDVNIFLRDNPIENPRIRALQEEVLGLDVSSKEAILSSGRRLGYYKLLIATGRDAPIPGSIPGLQGSDVFTLRISENAHNLQDAVGEGKRRRAGRRICGYLGRSRAETSSS